MDEKPRITRHGNRRVRERVGIPKKAVDRNAALALEKGLRYEETCGGLRRYLDWLYFKSCRAGVKSVYRVYGDHVYVFQDGKLITVLNMPPEHRKQAARLQGKKGIEGTGNREQGTGGKGEGTGNRDIERPKNSPVDCF